MADADIEMYDRALIKALTADNAGLRAEIERLRAALKTIRNWYIDHADDAEMMAQYAGKALAHEQTAEKPTVYLTQHWPHCLALVVGDPDACNCPHGANGQSSEGGTG